VIAADVMTGRSARRELAARVAGLADLWEATTGDPEIRIAVLDGPVDPTHPALRGARLQVVESVGNVRSWHVYESTRHERRNPCTPSLRVPPKSDPPTDGAPCLGRGAPPFFARRTS
jgi:hypothetical protein